MTIRVSGGDRRCLSIRTPPLPWPRRAPRAGLARRPWSCCRRPIPPNSPKRSSGPAAACRSSPSACGCGSASTSVAPCCPTTTRGRELHRDECPRRRQARASGKRRAEVARVSVERSELANGLTVVSHSMAEVETVSLGIWVGAGSRSETRERARRRPFPRAHGLQGHGAAQRQGHRRGDRGGRRRSQCRDRRRLRPPITRACCARTWRSRSTS